MSSFDDLNRHEKFLLLTGLMQTMLVHRREFTVEQIQEMNKLSDESRVGLTVDKDKSAETLMGLARRLVK